ncbi:MAG: argininosuccinate lyase [Deinococcota bacterium]|uniref:Argininosuccinate lyase n=1 Tax=Allomeiothermus silvanus (strain ATCC 700542 / DSM 9946 / NBRC 106475 / NCIMB 13440 / VI-R2) TaxID=526227 RepID=D7BA82_ALLS1|nr:argininosuccinate lyase [Allomeiothermus silvanus]ADH64217.1 argininosuccinate lyase [Allomeiothermus silvanus DSM 9946]MBI5811252.1 argininosuccinate lyase [Allomeiothermus silvanus]
MSQETQRTWGGRFSEAPNQLAQEFNASWRFDQRLALVDIEGSLAHAAMLAQQGIISPEEGETLRQGLMQVREEILCGKFVWREELEDVHMNVETRLTELVGPVGGKLHTARSRNDQVATDLRLWLRGELTGTLAELEALRKVLVSQAEKYVDPPLILPGYTHLQRAMPVLLSHWFLAYYEMLTRDAGRIQDAQRRLNESPLGAAALAGTGFPIDREFTARQLGFTRPMRNSLDAVGSRDFVLEALAALAIGQLTLSRMAEEIILYTSFEFGFAVLPDAFSTGSSIMPQKKNADIAELIRGKAGRVVGSFVGLATVVKGLPLAYNKDFQEDKEPLFDAVDTYRASLRLLTAMLPGLVWRPEPMAKAAESGFSLATELADYLAHKGLPFREAHHVVGQIVRYCIEGGKELRDLTLQDLQGFHALFEADALELTRLETAIHRRNSQGGTAPLRVREAIEVAKKEIGW